MASATKHYSFVPDPHTTDYLAMNDRQTDRSPSPGRKFWPFNRSRSSSPNTQGQQLQLDTSFNTTRSRKSSANSQNAAAVSPSGSNNSFVVRSVIRNPGGVSLPTSPAHEHSHGFFGASGPRQQSTSPGARRMTLEDSDDDMTGAQQQQLQYRRSKSKPLGAPASLSVPAGGPGGGVGYGTARSSNDGKPENGATANRPSPYYRPPSPSGSMKAGDFHKGAKERGRSPRKSVSCASSSSHGHTSHPADQGRSPSAHSATSSSSGKKPIARITAGPKSLIQQQQEVDHLHQHQFHQQQPQQQQHPSSRGPSPAAARQAGLSGPRQFPAGPPSPSGPGYYGQQHPHAHPQHNAGAPTMEQRGTMGFPLLPPQHAPGAEARDESPSRSRRFSFGIVGRSRKDSERSLQPPGAAAPLDGLPSPVDIPYGRSPHSPLRFDANGAETDYSRANSPFGSVSPARVPGSPNSSGFLSTLMGRQQTAEEREPRHQQQQQRQQHDDVPRSCSPGGAGGSNLAGKWFKGVFGRSPRGDEKDPNYGSDLSPYPFPQSGARDAEDEAAYAQKLASMRQARHIVDEERQRHLLGPTTPTGARGFDPNHDREFRPRQVVDSDADDGDDPGLDAALEFELGRKKSPPGRKPVPAYLPAAKPMGDGDDCGDEEDVTRQDEPLTPAQRIIQETRSKQLAREQIEAQRKQAITQQQQKMANPRETVAAHAAFNGPPTPPKSKDESKLNGHQQRFPSGAHQITREPAKGGALPPPSPHMDASATTTTTTTPVGQRNGSTLSPGSGPMPADMPLRDALQEMMVRFYRFERYSVPLIRSLETRLLDIERDSMLANNPQARTASIASHNSAEMDRWVHQMASLMKHEVGQLKAATREIKESRELVATVARHASTSVAPGVGLSMSVSSFGSLAAITPSASLQQMAAKPALQQQQQQQTKTAAAAGKRETNVSSSTFESAVPRKSNLGLPVGARPVLGKDDGKFGAVGGGRGGKAAAGSPTKANFGFASESSKEHKENSAYRDRSVSPNGRPRYTSVLGQPLEATSTTLQQDARSSPSPAESSRQGGGMKRDVSVQDRLKALVDNGTEAASSRSTSSSFASASASLPPTAPAADDQEDVGDESGTTEISAALAAIEASASTTTNSPFALSATQQQHEKKVSETTTTTTLRGDQHVVPVTKSSSHSSSNSARSVNEPLTPTVELAAEPISSTTTTISTTGAKELVANHDDDPILTPKRNVVGHLAAESMLTSPTKTHFGGGGGSISHSPTPSSSSSAAAGTVSGRISPNKLFAHKFAATGSNGSTNSSSGPVAANASASSRLGLVEKKRFAPPSSTTTGLGPGNVTTTVQARIGGKLSRTPSYTLDEAAAAPTSTAFSGLAKVKPVGHTATLRERVAFFDTAK